MPRVFVCNDTSDYFVYPKNADGSENLTVQQPACLAGAGEYVDYNPAPAGPDPAMGAVTPEQAAVQIAILGVGALTAFKGFAIGLMR